LIERLDQRLKRKLTLVSAPAGFGKTTLITSWLHGLEKRLQPAPGLAWLSLLRFIAYLTAALRTLAPETHDAAFPAFFTRASWLTTERRATVD
jgi:LuxR family maltose regulon positive regulatory protein